MDFNFRDKTEADLLGSTYLILGQGRRAAVIDFKFREGTQADTLRLLSIGPRKENR